MEGNFNDRYRLLEELERGRCLVSYLARDEVYGVEVVVDAVEPERSDAPHLYGRLKEILGRAEEISSPCIASLFGWKEEGGRIYVVREHVQGVPLPEIISGAGELPVEQVAEIAGAATRALAEAYGKGLFYLGLNPGQFLVDGGGGVRLLRVGYGWVLEEMEPLLAARVSPYRAPETDGGKEGGRTSDVYSLAVMIREMLPRHEGSPRLYSLLENSMAPLPRQRPSSSRLLLEGLEEAGVGSHGREAAGDAGEIADEGGKRGGGLGFPEEVAVSSPYVQLEKRPRGRPYRALLLILLGGVMVWLLYAAVAGSLGGGKEGGQQGADPVGEVEKVTLPDLEGFPVQEAKEVLRGLGLDFTSRQAPSRLWSADVVAAQEPQEGSVLEKGDTVCLVVSSGSDVEPQADEVPGQGETDPSTLSEPVEDVLGPGASEGNRPSTRDASPAFSPSPAVPLAPRARAELSTRAGSSPLYVAMDGSGSSDPDGGIARYVWDCGDGTVLEGARVQHVYDPAVTPMRFTVVLRVFDGDGLSDSCSLTVEVL